MLNQSVTAVGRARTAGVLLAVSVCIPALARDEPCPPEPLGHFKDSGSARGDLLGCSISFSGDVGLLGSSGRDDKADRGTAGAALIVARRGKGWAAGARITLKDAMSGDHFGSSVCLDGGTAIVGAFGRASSKGAAYVFIRGAEGWLPEAELTVPEGAPGDEFGYSVSVSGDTAVVGACRRKDLAGAAYVFVRAAGSSGVRAWTMHTELAPSEVARGDLFGMSVAVNGDTVVVGALGTTGSTGAAYVFVRSGGVWKEQARLVGIDLHKGDCFGNSVAVRGDVAVIGACAQFESFGAAYVFERAGSDWKQAEKLVPDDAIGGSDAERANADQGGRLFGLSVAVEQDIIAVGAPETRGRAGAAYVFARGRDGWKQLGPSLTASDSKPLSRFGCSVSVNGDTVFMGSMGKDENTGAMYGFGLGRVTIVKQPAGVKVPTGGTATLGVEAKSDASISYQWRLGGSLVSDGKTLSGSVISGAYTPEMTITGATISDAGEYVCTAKGRCASAVSEKAVLEVRP